MALKTHLKIALAWLRHEEVGAVCRLTNTSFFRNPVWLTREANAILVCLGVHSSCDDDPLETPEGESPYHHYFSYRLAVVTEAILELGELLEEQDE